jgi:hypothetical protein
MIEKMFKKPTLLTKVEKDIKFSSLKNFKHARSVGAVALNFKEMGEASKHYPIFFVKDGEGFTPVALLGVDNNHNLFVNKSGEWTKGRYIPTLVRLYPFVFTKTDKEKENSVSIAYDREYEGLNLQDGKKFFKEDGSLTEFGDSVMKFAEETFISLSQTKQLLTPLAELDLLSQIDVTLGKEGEKQYKLSGLFQVNANNLNKLNDEQLLKITKNGLLHLVYNHLDSSSNFDTLVNKLG